MAIQKLCHPVREEQSLPPSKEAQTLPVLIHHKEYGNFKTGNVTTFLARKQTNKQKSII